MKSRTSIISGFLLLILACVISVYISRPNPPARLHAFRIHSRGEIPGSGRGSLSISEPAAEASARLPLSVRRQLSGTTALRPGRSIPSPRKARPPLAPLPARHSSRHVAHQISLQDQSDTAPTSAEPPAVASFPVQLGRIPVDPGAPGNTLTAHGQTLTVQAYEVTETGNALSVETTPASNNKLPNSRGFTLEEELFRAKWGWQTFNQAQQTAAAISLESN